MLQCSGVITRCTRASACLRAWDSLSLGVRSKLGLCCRTLGQFYRFRQVASNVRAALSTYQVCVCVCVCVFLPLPSFLFWMMRSPGQLFLMKPFIHRLRFFVVVCCITMGRPQPCGNIHSGCKEDDTPLEGQPLAAFERL